MPGDLFVVQRMAGDYGTNNGPSHVQPARKVHKQTRSLNRFAYQITCFPQLPSKFTKTYRRRLAREESLC